MKYDLNNKTNRFAERTLLAFSSTLMQLLETKRFEDITVRKICEACNYPRATFYNYFDDSYDLLNYCWMTMAQEIELGDYLEIAEEKRIYIIFGRVYDYFDSCKDRLEKIMAHNSLDGALFTSFTLFLRQQVFRLLKDCPFKDKSMIPQELLAEHYSNTLQLVFEWCFLRKKISSKEEAEKCLTYLLSNFQ